jgi:hypothetical protein
VATAAAYASLAAVCAGTMLVWALRDAPFGYATVETVLRINPVAAALSVMGTPGFAPYGLVPGNWWCMGLAAAGCALVVWLRTRRLMQPW